MALNQARHGLRTFASFPSLFARCYAAKAPKVKVILKENIDGLGIRGEEVRAAAGHARNYLIPRGMGVYATEENKALFQRADEEALSRARKAEADLANLKRRFENLRVTVKRHAPEKNGKLYGSVTAANIAEQLKKQHRVVVPDGNIELDTPIKALGEYNVPTKISVEGNEHIIEVGLAVQVVKR